MDAKYTVGQVVWLVLKNHATLGIAVTKVGRKWVSLADGRRFDADTGQVDGGGNPGRVYQSREAYEAEGALKHAWRVFANAVYHYHLNQPPTGVTLEAIAEARRLLGLQVKP